jgi:homocitrate synthase NifV
MKKFWLIDSTLRDGEQAPGVSFTFKEKMKIACMLDDLGLEEIEAGTPAIGKKEIEIIRTISQAGFSFKTTSWCRAKAEDINAAKKASTNGINLSFPVSSYHLSAMNKPLTWVTEEMKKLIPVCRDNFEYTALGLQDASRTDYGIIKELTSLAISLGVNRIRIADTVGILNPLLTSTLFNNLQTDFPDFDFEFHGHNDLGMAAANTVTALLSGAGSASCTINGLGERAGNAAFEEVVMALQYSSGIKTKIQTNHIQAAAEYVAACSSRKIQEAKPITGSKVFTHESGIHINLMLQDKTTYQLIDPGLTGRPGTTEIVYGKHSGSGALIDFFKKRGICVSPVHLDTILKQIKIKAEIMKKPVLPAEIMDLYHQLT